MSSVRTTTSQVVSSFGGPEQFRLEEGPLAAPGAGEVQLGVAAAAVNPVDLATRTGRVVPADAARFPMTLGWDVAGTIEQVGEDVAGWQVGDRVAATTVQPADQNGTYTERITLAANLLAPVPDALDLEVAAAVPLAGLTASQVLAWLDVPAGGILLVDAPLGAVGRMVVQLAHGQGITVVAVVEDADRHAALALGATEVVRRGGYADAVRALRAGGVDAAADLVGGAAAQACLASVRDGGAYISTVPPFLDGIGPTGPVRDIRFAFQDVRPDTAALTRLLDAVGRGDLACPVERVYPLTQAAQAHRRQAQGGLRGKLVLRP